MADPAIVSLVVRVLALLALLVPVATAAGAATSAPADAATVAAPPASVRVVVGVPLEAGLARGEARGPRGAVRHGATVSAADPEAIVVPVPADGRGTYRVAWSGLTRDGHPLAGVLAFSVGDDAPAAPPVVPPGRDGTSPWAIVARLLVLVGVLGTAGMAIAREWVIAGAWRAGGIAPPGAGRGHAVVRDDAIAAAPMAVRAWWRAWWALAIAWVAGLLVALPVQAASLGGEWGALLTDSRWGSAWMGLVLLAVLAMVVALLTRRADPLVAPGGARMPALALPGALGAILLSWSGHAATGTDATLGTTIDMMHGWATALWLGGLLMLAVLGLPLLRAMPPVPRMRFGASVIVRFSALAVGAVVVLVITGVYRALAELPSPAALWTTGYGLVLLAKLAVFAVMLGLAGWNRLVLHPRLERLALGIDDAPAADALAALRVSVRAEVLLGTVVMVAVAILAGLMPPT